jgi:hypothetical protein
MPDDNGITLQEAQNALVEAIAARSALMGGAKSYRISGGGIDRQVTREDLDKINADIIYWEGRVRRLASGGVRLRGVTFS